MADEPANGNAEAARREELRQIAAHTCSRLQAAADEVTAEVSRKSGWLTASLLALNGAGALAIVNGAEKLPDPIPAALAFGVGIFFTLMNAFTIQLFAAKMAPGVNDMLWFWRNVEITGNLEIEQAKLVEAKSQKWVKIGWFPPLLGWISGVAFFAGAISLTVQLKDLHKQPPSQARIEAKG